MKYLKIVIPLTKKTDFEKVYYVVGDLAADLEAVGLDIEKECPFVDQEGIEVVVSSTKG